MATKREICSSPTTGSPTPHPVRCHRFIRRDEFPDEAREPGFGLAHPVPDDAPRLDRAIAQAGRDPDWAPNP